MPPILRSIAPKRFVSKLTVRARIIAIALIPRRRLPGHRHRLRKSNSGRKPVDALPAKGDPHHVRRQNDSLDVSAKTFPRHQVDRWLPAPPTASPHRKTRAERPPESCHRD
jgi:hypothetical protein